MTPYEELGFSYLTQMKDDYTTNSHYLTYTFLFRKVGRMYFLILGVKGLIEPSDVNTLCEQHKYRLFVLQCASGFIYR